MARISWHPAFVQAIQLELEEYLDVLTFETEHQLTTEPLKIDVLIIKKKKNVVIEKNIGRIFQQFNIVEYKSPKDRATVAAYHKTHSYARLYAALNRININDVSVTVVATRRPKKLLAFLNKQYTVHNVQPGIYIVEGDTCPTQIIVSEELSDEDNLWLNYLRNDLVVANLERLSMAKEPELPMDAYVYVIGEANIQAMEELEMQKRKGFILSERLDAHFTAKYGPQFIARGEARGKAEAGQNMVLAVLRARFKRVPKGIEKAIRALADPAVLESWAVQAATCQTLDEFAEALK